jgi:chemotaxis protein histidine kinase CheA
MKTLSLIFIVLFFSTAVLAQDVNYNGPAKTYVTSFYKQAEDTKKNIETQSFVGAQTKVDQLGRAITTIKNKDAAYNTSSMEEVLKKLKEQLEAAKAAREGELNNQQNATINGIEFKALLQYLFVDANIQVGDNTLVHVKEEMDLYSAKLEKALSINKTQYTKHLADYMRYVERFTSKTNQFIEGKERIMKDAFSNDGLESNYYEMKFYQLYWDAAQKIYPEQSQFAANYQKLTAMISKIGNLDQMKATAQKNNIEKIKNAKLPPATVKDPSLEKILINGFNSKYGSVYNGTALKAVLTQDGWTIERHNISGVVTGRNRTGKIAYKGKDGKCYLLSNNIFIYQAFIGSSFSNTEVIYNGLGGEEMLCENVK